MTFAQMIAGLKQGRRYRRPAWAAGTVIMFKPREADYSGPIVGSIIRLNAEGDVEAFSAPPDDLDATDWAEAA